ncbi:MAG: hypothetical protein HND43_06680 [Armatimonadetes bacterium]|nr:hypothetical protein [Armatimonadota bacterium]
MGGPCSKITGSKSYHPVCSVRTASGEFFPVCSDRLVPAKARVLTSEHLEILAQVASALFPGVDESSVGFRRQVGSQLGEKRQVYLDYVLSLNETPFIGRSRVILEVQGGGETSNTGTISNHVTQWMDQPERTNEMLRQPQNHVNIIPNNAWKRQLEQVFRKAPLARAFGGGFALVMGSVLYEYVRRSVKSGSTWYPDWDVALVELAEQPSSATKSVAVSAGRSVFMSYSDFVASVSENDDVDRLRNPFQGVYTTLHNYEFEIH